jgi:hypothetical protein
VSFGNADWKGILKSVNKRDYLRYISYMAEKNLAAMRKNSLNKIQPILYQTFIVDMEGISMRQMAYKPCTNLFFFSNLILLNHFDFFFFVLIWRQKLEMLDLKEYIFVKPITRKVFVASSSSTV